MEQRKVSGNAGTPHLFADWPLTCGLAAPSEKNLAEYLRSHPHCEVYAGHEKPPGATGGICEPESLSVVLLLQGRCGCLDTDLEAILHGSESL